MAGTADFAAEFDKELKALTPGKYYYKAFATNKGGVSYGKVKEFNITGPAGEPKAGDAIRVVLDGQMLQFDVPPVIENDRTLVPLRVIFEALGADVEWNGETQTVTAKRSDTEIKLIIGGEAYVNGQAVELDVPAKIIEDRTLVPLRFVSEALGCQVDWDGVTRTVSISG